MYGGPKPLECLESRKDIPRAGLAKVSEMAPSTLVVDDLDPGDFRPTCSLRATAIPGSQEEGCFLSAQYDHVFSSEPLLPSRSDGHLAGPCAGDRCAVLP